VKYLGHIIGSGIRKPDDEKVATVKDMQVPETKKQVRRLIGFFSYFRDYIPNFAEIAQPLTDLTGKRVPNRVLWGEKENLAFEKLKEELCKATTQSMSIADFSKPYLIEVDSSANTVGAALLQYVEGQGNRPIAFASQKLTASQKAWSTKEKEAYAAIWALQKFRNWIFGQPTTVIYSDHNLLTYITESSTKSAKLIRWLLFLQSHNVTFRYKEGRKNVVADCLSRLDSATE